MKFFYADSVDQVDPDFDFLSEKFSKERDKQHTDQYAHELLGDDKPYDGILVSRALLSGKPGEGRYTMAERKRFLLRGARNFLRFPPAAHQPFEEADWPIMGDCGAFSYRKAAEPPYTVDEVVKFYEEHGFTQGVSVDHMIGAYDERYDQPGLLDQSVPQEWKRRYELTLELASEFMRATANAPFEPLGAAQGWSPRSYASAAERLVKMGYRYIAIGGLVPLRTPQILHIIQAVNDSVGAKAKLHLLGVTRFDNLKAYRAANVVSLDSTSPLRQAFKDARNNYYADGDSEGKGKHFTAIRIPQLDGVKVKRRIQSGKADQAALRIAERVCLDAVRQFDAGKGMPVDDVLAALKRYAELCDAPQNWKAIERTLRERPWQNCVCPVCKKVGVEVIIFRGANRNRRRGFHNLWWTHRKLSEFREGLDA